MRLSRSASALVSACALLLPGSHGQSCTLVSVAPTLLDAPADAAAYAAWLSNASSWANASLTAQAYTGVNTTYGAAALEWASRAVLQAHVPAHDARVAPQARGGEWTLGRWLDGLEADVGPVDAVVVWPASLAALGLDARSHVALARELPAGGGGGGGGGGGSPPFAALAAMAADLKARPGSPRLLLGLLPWDTGTAGGASALTCTGAAETAVNASADGLYLRDTAWAPAGCATYNGSLGEAVFALQTDACLAFANDSSVPAALGYTTATLAEPLSRAGVFEPPCAAAAGASAGSGGALDGAGVSAYKWLERRHRPVFGNLFSTSRAASALAALVNGGGLAIADDVFGFANPLTPADAALVRRAAAVLRFAAALTRAPASAAALAVADQPWAPTRPVAADAAPALVASEFWAPCPPTMSAAAGNCTLLTFAAPGAAPPALATLNVSAAAARAGAAGALWFDLYSGVPINATGTGTTTSGFLASLDADSVLRVTLEAGGGGAALAVPAGAPVPAALLDFLTGVIRTSTTPLAALRRVWYPLNQTVVPPQPSRPAAAAPPGMALMPGALDYAFAVTGVLPEPLTRADGAAAAAGVGPGMDVQFPWEDFPRAEHGAQLVDLAPFFIDTLLVTNDDFAAFMRATGYNASQPPAVNGANFLRHWVDLPNGTRSYNASAGDGPRPVTWVGRPDAAAHCAWRGARLPTDVEWQAAAQAARGAGPQGSDYRRWPWGNTTCADTPGACPPTSAAADAVPPPVGGFPAGASALGLLDLVGAVWQITDQFSDGVTTAALLRGGSAFQAADADATAGGFAPRYLAAAADLAHHVRLPLVDESSLRSAFVGFRCVVDTPASAAVAAAAAGAGARAFGAASWR